MPVRRGNLDARARGHDLRAVHEPFRLPFGMIPQNQPARGAAGVMQFVVQPDAEAQFFDGILHVGYERIPHLLAFQIIFEKGNIGRNAAIAVFFEHIQRRFIHSIRFEFARVNDGQRAEFERGVGKRLLVESTLVADDGRRREFIVHLAAAGQ